MISMKNNVFFTIGLVIDAFALVLTLSNALFMNTPVKGVGGVETDLNDGLTDAGRLANWLIPVVLTILIAAGWWCRVKGKIALANILVWIPALPMLVGILIWAFLALLFLVAG